MEMISMPSIEGVPVKKIPERKRPRQITARPKAARRCAWRAMQRAEERVAGLVMTAAASNRSAI